MYNREIALTQKNNLEYYISALMSFLIPFMLGGPQIFVGSLVNFYLFRAAYEFKKIQTLSIIILPSLAVLSRGMIFGPMSYVLIYFLPVIWLSNSVIVFGVQYLNRFCHSIVSVFIVAFAKALMMSVYAFLLIKLDIVPFKILYSMSSWQFVTASLGGLFAISDQKLKRMEKYK